MSVQAKRGIHICAGFLAGVLFCSLLAFAAVAAAKEQKRRANVQPPLISWSPERIKAELAEAGTVMDCGDLMGEQAQGLRCSVWALSEEFSLMSIEQP